MKNAKALFYSALLSVSGMVLADCSTCNTCPRARTVCTQDGCTIETPRTVKTVVTPAKQETVVVEEQVESVPGRGAEDIDVDEAVEAVDVAQMDTEEAVDAREVETEEVDEDSVKE